MYLRITTTQQQQQQQAFCFAIEKTASLSMQIEELSWSEEKNSSLWFQLTRINIIQTDK